MTTYFRGVSAGLSREHQEIVQKKQPTACSEFFKWQILIVADSLLSPIRFF
jgi:hypothetical protein